jgi:SAM-dependent methyltransferase
MAIPGGMLDYMELEPEGILRVIGWSETIIEDHIDEHVHIIVNDTLIKHADQKYGILRPDLWPRSELSGFMLEWIGGWTTVKSINLKCGEGVFRLQDLETLTKNSPHYHFLLKSGKKVFHRTDIYGSGPPVGDVSPEVKTLSLAHLLPPILDFGCGAGALVKNLRENGLEAVGLEIDRDVIRQHALREVAEHLIYYHGELPLPFPSKSFQSVTAIEVLEHINDYESVLSEIFRLAARRVLLTVPDMTAIPVLHKHGVVPWHLLESTHVNFFTPESLRHILVGHTGRDSIRLFRIGNRWVNGTFVPGSIAALVSLANSESDPRH